MSRFAGAGLAAVLLVAGCGADRADGASGPTALSVTPSSEPTASTRSSDASETSATSAPATAGEPGSTAPSSPATSPAATSYQPPPAGQAVDGACPFLTAQQVADDTGQRVGATQIIPGDPQPICLFVRTDGGALATIRALSFASPGEAVLAVDHYLPRDRSSLETKPDGWSGGSLRTDDGGSIYGVSKGGYAVIATSNVMTVASRRLVVDAITNLGW